MNNHSDTQVVNNALSHETISDELEDGLSTNDANITGVADSREEEDQLLKQEEEAEKLRIAANEVKENEARLLAVAKEEEDAAARVREEAERKEKIRIESEAAATAAAKQAELERLEREQQLEHERLAEERRQQQEQLKQKQEDMARQLAEERRLEKDRLERDRVEKDRIERERLEKERLEKERLEKEHLEKERLEKERLEIEKKREQERIDRDSRLKDQRLKEEEARAKALEAKLERDRLAAEAEANRVAMEEQSRRRQLEEQALQKANVDAENATPAEFAEECAHVTMEAQAQTEGFNIEARDAANQLAHVELERNQLQSFNQELQTMCEQLRNDLHRAAETISKLNERIADQEETERIRQEQEAQRVEEEESNLVAATKREMEVQITHIRESMQAQIHSLEKELIEERKLSVDQQHELQRRLEESTARISSTESEMKALASKKETNMAKQMQASEKAAAKAVALLDKKEEEVQQLQQVIADMREAMKKNKIEGEEAEEEMDELHHENEELHLQVEKLQKENSQIKAKLASLSDESEKLGGLKMELQMLEEERRREKSALESAHEKTSEDHALVLSERDALKAQVSDLEQFLAATQADLELANTDCSRALLANENLQRALEDFQSERDAEIALLTEQQRASEEAITAAHAASLEAMREANAANMRDVQYAADKSVQNALSEIDKMEATICECRKDNMNLRRALDEAISRLQTNQEDVIDRSLIKNIILDWHAKKGKAKRDVMILLGSILHFTEDEKDKAFIGEGPGTFDKVVGAVAAPLPPAKLNVDKIEGDTVREKWVNFLLAETGDEEGGGIS
ncbi:hypothetical protein ACHAXH_006362 [Discostella pseudostelligera]